MHLFLLALPFLCAFASALHKVKENIEHPPHDWLRNGPAPSAHLLKLRIALHQPHFPVLQQYLSEVSNPKHKRYGAYLSKEETDALMAPHPDALDAVNAWLYSYGIEEKHLYRSSAQDWVTVRVPVATAEDMLNTEYHIYTQLGSGESIIRTTNYSLPDTVFEHVELIQPTTMFSRRRPPRTWSTALRPPKPLVPRSSSDNILTGPAGNPVAASCNGTITVSCLRQLYNAVGYNSSAMNGNKIGISLFSEQYANNQDLQHFFQLQNPAAYGFNYTFVSINGGLNNQSIEAVGEEANLDTQFAYGLAYPTQAILYSTGGLPPQIPDALHPTNDNEPYADWLDYMLSQPYLPQTVSTSFADKEHTVPYSYAIRVCSGFAALGARGVSLLFGSGDYGVGDGNTDPETQMCFDNNGSNRTIFLPEFPASCPYVTTVGATTYIPEVAANLSGGGFSNYFPRPSYQDTAISKYLETLPPETYDGLYNPQVDGRGFPDVAAQGRDYAIIYKGKEISIGGTSAATPAFAALVSMLNDARLNAGKPPLGFLNPWLYQTGFAGLNEITVGDNPGCGTRGFNATTGWNPVTGFGTPNFEKLLPLAMDV